LKNDANVDEAKIERHAELAEAEEERNASLSPTRIEAIDKVLDAEQSSNTSCPFQSKIQS
jgi:hypothetical protein